MLNVSGTSNVDGTSMRAPTFVKWRTTQAVIEDLGRFALSSTRDQRFHGVPAFAPPDCFERSNVSSAPIVRSVSLSGVMLAVGLPQLESD